MAVRPILLYPEPVLKRPCKPVNSIDGEIRRIARDLADTLDRSPGVALAAPQIGVPLRMILVDAAKNPKAIGSKNGRILMINPVCFVRSGERIVREGCLSVPEYTGRVLRAEKVRIDGIGPDGMRVSVSAEGFEALAFQHEIDHLDGILFLDRIASLSTDLFRRKRG